MMMVRGQRCFDQREPMKIIRALLICSLLSSLAAAAGALNPDRDIHQLMHRSWGEKDGYPARPSLCCAARPCDTTFRSGRNSQPIFPRSLEIACNCSRSQ